MKLGKKLLNLVYDAEEEQPTTTTTTTDDGSIPTMIESSQWPATNVPEKRSLRWRLF